MRVIYIHEIENGWIWWAGEKGVPVGERYVESVSDLLDDVRDFIMDSEDAED